MRIFLTGATGFIGRALVPALQREGHQVVTWVRSEDRARGQLGADVQLVPITESDAALEAALQQCHAVINLAGEPILGGRWTPSRRHTLTSSRVALTERLVAAMARVSPRPAVLVSSSAVGYYGSQAGTVLTETAPAGTDFLASLCAAWEAASLSARPLGVRVAIVRTGVVLGREGGALAQMLPPFRLGAGGPIGSGKQYFPWIHLHDLVRIFVTAVSDTRYDGPINGVAPEEATSASFARALGRALRRPAFLPVPSLALRIIFGEAACVLLDSERARPARLEGLGFSFAFGTLAAALHDVAVPPEIRIDASEPQRAGDGSSVYLAARPPRYRLQTRTIIDAPLDQVFAFFSKAQNLGLITPATMKFSIVGEAPALRTGALIDYVLRIGPVPIKWRTAIESWAPPHRFVDAQLQGPYTCWWHEHTFRADGDRTIMEDRVLYTPPLGVLGRLANRWFVAPTLRRIFAYRGDVIRLRFGHTGNRGRAAA